LDQPFAPLPARIEDGTHLDDLLSAPAERVIDLMGRLDGDILILGAGGKMGPSLARMARRASEAAGRERRVLAVSRFTNQSLAQQMRRWGIDVITCDLLDEGALDSLPDAPNVMFMAGMKFGTAGQQALTWAMNAYLPALVCRRFRSSRIVAFSTGNVYPFVTLSSGGSCEEDDPGPTGEYAMSCLGRERIIEHFSWTFSIPAAILRLNYAVAVRYGVLADVARAVWERRPIDLTMGAVNVIWQGDANAMALQALDHVCIPPLVVNVAGPDQVSVRSIATRFGGLMDRAPMFAGEEAATALLSNGERGHRLFGYPRVGVEQMAEWIADWIMRGGEDLGKPTRFETRDGRF
jgi:dTDP-4-dehydrorhamnose reductase